MCLLHKTENIFTIQLHKSHRVVDTPIYNVNSHERAFLLPRAHMYKAIKECSIRDALGRPFALDKFGYNDINQPQLILSLAAARELA